MISVEPSWIFVLALLANKWNFSKASDSDNKKLIIYDTWEENNEIEPLKYLAMMVGIRSPDDPVELPELWDPCRCLAIGCMCELGIRYGDSFQHEIRFGLIYMNNIVVLALDLNDENVALFPRDIREPICIPILLPIPMMSCLYFYNVGGETTSEYGQVCYKLEMKVLMIATYEIPFECIRFYPAEGVKYVPADTPYLAEVEERVPI